MAMVMDDQGEQAPDPVEVGSVEAALGPAGKGLAAAIDGVAAVVGDMVPAELADAVVAVNSLRARLEAVEVSLVGAYDRSGDWVNEGYRYPTAAVKDKCRIAKGHAGRKIAWARKLESMPDTSAAWAAGAIDISHVDKLVKANQSRWADEFAQAEAMLVANAMTMDFADFAKTVDYFVELMKRRDNDGDGDGEGAPGRGAHLSPVLDGYGRFDADLDPVGYQTFSRVLRKIEQELFDADWAQAKAELGEGNVTIDKLRRTPAQRRHDALIEMATRAATAPADGKRPEPLVVVTIDHATFEAELKRRVGAAFEYPAVWEGTCELADGTVISPGDALALAVEGHVRRMVFDTPDEKTKYGRKSRFYRGPLREMIQVRDRHCQGPGCDVPAYECDVDHIIDWQHHGETDGDNGEPECPWHNTHKHQYDISRDPITGRTRWRKRK